MNDQETIERALELLQKFDSGMLVTSGQGGRPHARPMKLAHVADDCTITFITSLDSTKVDEIRKDPLVGLTLQSNGAFVSVSGRARIETDAELKRKVWGPFAELWFQKPDDPEAALLILEPKSMEYWDQRGVNALRFAFEAVRAIATGEPPRNKSEIHSSVRLSGDASGAAP